MIAIIDYGMGNLHSVSKAIERLGFDYVITDDPRQLEKANGLLLPGVGAFGDAMKQLKAHGFDEKIFKLVEKGVPLLGICLGMQLLFSSSEEGGEHEGLNLLKGHVKKLPSTNSGGQSFKIPHMGWNELRPKMGMDRGGDGLKGEKFQRCLQEVLQSSTPEGYVYFVHSYYVALMEENDLMAYADYSDRVPAIVGRGNVIGMQFHPEKSGATGVSLLKQFCKVCHTVQGGIEHG